MVFHGLFGKTLSHSISPELHKEIYKVTGYDAAYKIMEFQNDELENAVNALKILKIKGVNVTIPYKEKVLPFLFPFRVGTEDLSFITNQLPGFQLGGRALREYGFFLELLEVSDPCIQVGYSGVEEVHMSF